MVEWRDIATAGRVGVPRGKHLANEIDTDDLHDSGPDSTAITGSGNSDWLDPKYDAAGNMIQSPRPGRMDILSTESGGARSFFREGFQAEAGCQNRGFVV